MSGAYRIKIRARVFKQLAAIPKKFRQRIEIKIDELAMDAYPPGCKKLEGESNLWRIRIGDYRVIYSVDANVRIVEIQNAGHRQSIYN